MGLLTDVYVATFDELQAACPGRVPPAPEPLRRTVRNPFTKQEQVVPEWLPSREPSQNVDPREELANLARLRRVQWKNLDQVKFTQLYAICCEVAFEAAIDEVMRPALLIGREPDNDWWHEIPAPLVRALAEASPEQLGKWSGQWADTDEMQADNFRREDVNEALRELAALARAATTSGLRMYLYVSL